MGKKCTTCRVLIRFYSAIFCPTSVGVTECSLGRVFDEILLYTQLTCSVPMVSFNSIAQILAEMEPKWPRVLLLMSYIVFAHLIKYSLLLLQWIPNNTDRAQRGSIDGVFKGYEQTYRLHIGVII